MVLLAVSVVVAAVVLWTLTLVKPYRVSSGSMAPTAVIGQRIMADHLGDDDWTPRVGDVVVFKAPGGAETGASQECGAERSPGQACLVPLRGRTHISFVKRVVGAPGDRVRIERGRVIRNGARVKEPFVRPCEQEICNLAEFTVPRGEFFVLGDNRGDSSDSRFWGPVPRSQIIGRAFATYWPPARLGAL